MECWINSASLSFILISIGLTVALDIDTYLLVVPKRISGTGTTEKPKDAVTPELQISVDLHGVERILDLRLQRNLLPDGFMEIYQRNGTTVRNRPDVKEIDLCHYRGTIRNVSESWAAVSVCHGRISGSIFDGLVLYHLTPHGEEPTNSTFGTHKLHKTHSSYGELATKDANEGDVRKPPRVKRSPKTLPEPYGVSSKTRYVEMALVVDNKVFVDLKSDMAVVRRRCKDIANIVNALYAPLNVYVTLVGIVVWSEKDEISLSTKGDETLTNFLHYRKMRLVHDIPNDNAQLITGVQFQGGVVGKALKGPICTYEFSGGVSMDHSPIVGLVATTVAHELGHNFGMEHDNDTQCVCADDRCIMAASSSAVSPTKWSSCSVDGLNHAFDHGMDYCLLNKPKSLVEGPVCGNMFLEPGEECDCGLSENCNNPCCDAATCKLHRNATCGTGPCCDLRTCHLKNAGTECRSAKGDCDLSEYCTGDHEFCPSDVFKQDGTTCAEEKAYCYQGKCSTHSDQCRLLWGSSGNNSDLICYRQNIHGNRTGHCGYDRPSQNYSKCSQDDTLCGVLHCSHLNERLEFGMESVSILSHSFYNVGGKIIPCRTASIDLGLANPDPGLVPNGAKCGDDKMCLNQKCVPVASVVGTSCPFNCHGNGFCNSNLKCHCKTGFAPPYCDYPGFGGSEDSGPAVDPMGSTTIYLMTFFFLGLIPVLILLGFCYYYYRNPEKRQQLWEFKRKRPNYPQRPDILPIHLMTAEQNHQPEAPKDAEQNGSVRKNSFGKFKGFTLSPLSEQPEDTSPASPHGLPKLPPPKPAPPTQISRVASTIASTFGQKAVLRPAPVAHTQVPLAPLGAIPTSVGVIAAKRPTISGPVLNQTTAAAGKNVLAVRPAPSAPKERKTDSPTRQPLLETVQISSRVEVTVTSVVPSPRTEKKQRPVSSPTAFLVKHKDEEPQATEQESRNFGNPFSNFQRFFRSGSKPPEAEKVSKLEGDGTLKKNLKRLDRQSLRNLDISAPIAQETQLSVKVTPVRPAPMPPNEIEGTGSRVRFSGQVGQSDSEDENPRSSVERTNSMRISNVTPKPKIPKFGSMRRTKRPVSMPSARPKSPPPNPPAPPVSSIPKKNSFVKDSSPEYLYDDCSYKKELITPDELSENFYENIDEKSGESKQTDEDNSSAGSEDGLLSEIVSELTKDNVYATAMKKSDRNTPEPLECLKFGVRDGQKALNPGSKNLTSLISKPIFAPTVTSSNTPRSTYNYTPTIVASPLRVTTASSVSSTPVPYKAPSLFTSRPVATSSSCELPTVSSSVSSFPTIGSSLTSKPLSSVGRRVAAFTPSTNNNTPVTSSVTDARPVTSAYSNTLASLLASRNQVVNANASPVSVGAPQPNSASAEAVSVPNSVPFSYLNIGTKSSVLSRPVATITPNTIAAGSVLVSKPDLLSSVTKPSAPSSVTPSTDSAQPALATSLVTKVEKKAPPLPAVGPVADVVTGVGSIKIDRPDYQASQPESKIITNTTVTFPVSAPAAATKPNSLNDLSKPSPLVASNRQPVSTVQPKPGRVTSPVRTTVKSTSVSAPKPVTTVAGKAVTKTSPAAKTVAPKPSVNGSSAAAVKPSSVVKKNVSTIQSRVNTGIKK